MSKENRKKVYDKLMASGKEANISPALKKEFGSIMHETPEKKSESPKDKGKRVY